VSFFSVVFYRHTVYFELIGDTYAAIAVSAAFSLYISFTAPNVHEKQEFFETHPTQALGKPVSTSYSKF